MRRIGGVLLAVVVALGVGACATFDPLEVKARLVGEKSANLTRIGVVSSSGAVYLSGAVESTAARARAEALTRDVKGVARVVNALEVRTLEISPTP